MSTLKFGVVIILGVICSIFAYDVRVEQTDWMGGGGIYGPVANWGTQYAERESVTTATPGMASLIATEWDYSAWIRHEIVSGTIAEHFQGLMPADIDGDGDIDIVGLVGIAVKWFEQTTDYTFVAHTIGTALGGGTSWTDTPCSWVDDIDKDGDTDVLIASDIGIGVEWFENIGGGATWNWHLLDGVNGYHRISSADFDCDGDIDIVAVDNAHSTYSGNIYLFRNNGGMSFVKELAVNLPYDGFGNGWRVYPADFNGDGYPDLYTPGFNDVFIMLNDGTGHFSISPSFSPSSWYGDGAWAQDIDMDGDMDLVTGGGSAYDSFHAFLNNGTGTDFTMILLTDEASDYYDGAIAADIDLDGFPDIAGVLTSVGWFRQNPTAPLNFTLYTIDTYLLGSGHWIYTAPVGKSCSPTMDILVSNGNYPTGYHYIYENNMILAYASFGYLESSVLDVASTSTWHRIGWDACIPYDNSIAFYWRAGDDVATFLTLPWNGPIAGDVLDTPDSVDIYGTGRYFQYKVEFQSGDDIAVLHKFWVEYDTFALAPPTVTSIEYSEETDCDGVNTVEICYTIDSPDSVPAYVLIEFSYDGGASWTISPITVTDVEGDLGTNVSPGEHCFNWLLSYDIPNFEGRNCSARIIVSGAGLSDTAYYSAPLDSRPPDVQILLCPEQISRGDSTTFNWFVNDIFWNSDPGTVFVQYCSREDTIITSDLSYVWHPQWDSIYCDSATFRVVMRDSFCNWGEDTCAVSLCPDVSPPEIIPIDTLSQCFYYDYSLKYFLQDTGAGLDYSSISVTEDDSAISYSLTADTISINGGEEIRPGDTVTICISVSDANTICPPNDTMQCWIISRCPNTYGCARMPNPFTPNYDMVNDYVQFTFPDMEFQMGIINIYDLHNVLMRKIDVPIGEGAKELARWNGKDKSGKNLPQGLYLYTIEVNGEIVCNGTVTIAR